MSGKSLNPHYNSKDAFRVLLRVDSGMVSSPRVCLGGASNFRDGIVLLIANGSLPMEAAIFEAELHSE